MRPKIPSTDSRFCRRGPCAWLASLLVLLALVGGSAHAAPQEAIEVRPAEPKQAWRIESFAEDAGLSEGFVFQAAFEENGTGWFAASDGLYRYDGYRWQQFGIADGLPSAYVRCVTIASDGRLWVGTDTGAGTFQQGRFDLSAAPEQLAGPSVRRIVEGPDGALWFCCDRWPDPSVQAGLTCLHDGRWTHFTTADGLPSDYVSNVFFDSSGLQFVLTRAGLAEMDDGGRFRQPLVEAGIEGVDDYIWSLLEISPGHLLAASSNAFFERVDGRWTGAPTDGPNRERTLLATTDGQVLSLPQSGRSFVRLEGREFVAATDDFLWSGDSTQHLSESPDGAVWAVGGRLILRWDRRGDLHSVFEDVPKPVLADGEGAIWFADRKRVLRRLRGQWWAFPDAHGPICSDEAGGVWMANGRGAVHWTTTGLRAAPELAGVGELELIGVDAHGSLWALGNDGREWLALGLSANGWRRTSLGGASASKPRVSVDSLDGGLWAVFGKLAAPRRLVRAAVTPERHLEIAMPDEVHLAEKTEVTRFSDGSLWLFGYFGAYRCRGLDAGTTWSRVEELSRQHVNTVAHAGDSLWFVRSSTSGGRSGLSLLHDGSWSHRDLEVRRLIGWSRTGGPILAQGNRLYRMQMDSLEDERVVPTYVEGRVRDAVDDGEHAFWIGARGLAHRIRDDGLPPETTLIEASSEVLDGGEIRLRVRGHERFRSRARTDPFLVETRVDDGPWTSSGLHEGEPITIASPGIGSHRLAVRVIDGAGEADPTPVMTSFEVLPVPLQSRPWFGPVVAIVFALVLALTAFALVARYKLALRARDLSGLVEVRTRALLGSELEYRTLFEESRDAIVTCDVAGNFSDANRAAIELFDLDPNHLGTASLAASFDEPLDLTLVSEGKPVRLTRGGGSQSIFLSSTTRRSEDGKTIGFLVIARDVTLQMQLEEHLNHTLRMEAIGRLASGVAHEFSNSLAAILGHCELIERFGKADPELRTRVGVIRDQTLRARELTEQIQVFSRVETGRSEVIDLNEGVLRTRNLLSPSLDHSVDLDYRLDPAVGRVRMAPGKLEQVVVNLVLNAADAMPGGGFIRIVTDRAVLDGAEAWSLAVVDTGHGMDEETRRRVFEPFFTTKSAGSGTGLGLAVVYGIVEQAGGQVSVQSTIDQGTTFRVTLPACTEELTVDKSEGRWSSKATKASGRVLVVDDEHAIRSYLETTLVHLGYEVTVASNAKDARVLFMADPSPYDLLIADLIMPGKGGRELADRLVAADPRLRVILMSGQSALRESDGSSDPNRPFLVKPFQIDELLSLIADMFGESAPRNAPNVDPRSS